MNKELQNLLYRSFDSELTPAEQKKLDAALASAQELQEEKLLLASMRSMVSKSKAQKFKPFFAAKVMQQIKKKPNTGDDFISSLLWSFRVTAIATVAIVAVLFMHNTFVRKDISLDALLSMPQASIEETWELDIPGENL